MEKQNFLEKLWAILVEFFTSWFKSKPAEPKKDFEPFWLLTKDQFQTSGEWADLWRCKIELVKPGYRSEPIYCRTGVRGAQEFLDGLNAGPAGTLKPIPQGKYKIGSEDWGLDLSPMNKVDNYNGSIGKGMGPVGWYLTPLFKMLRDLFYVHYDVNFKTDPGTAGCPGISHLADLKKFVALKRANPGVSDFYVFWGLPGMVLPDAGATPPKPEPTEEVKLNIEWDESPNHNASRDSKVDTLVLHNTDGTLASAVAHFNNPSAQVSAHYIVGRDGRVVKMVQEAHTAWHSGTRAMNHRSIGIEIEAYEKAKGLTPIQEKNLVALIEDICRRNSISLTRIIPHRKNVATSCPGWVWPTDADFNSWIKKNLA